jgi:hypothetical protein
LFARVWLELSRVETQSVAMPLLAKASREGSSLGPIFLKATSYVTAIGWSFFGAMIVLAGGVTLYVLARRSPTIKVEEVAASPVAAVTAEVYGHGLKLREILRDAEVLNNLGFWEALAALGIASDLDRFLPLTPRVMDQTQRRVLQAEKNLAVARLDALDAREARTKWEWRARERRARVRPALLLVLAPLALWAALAWLGVVRGGETRRAMLAAAAGLALYHLALPALGLRYSLTAVNKDEWLPAFFRKDMALGLAVCALVVAAGAWRERRRQGAGLFDLARYAWLVTAAFCFAFVVKVAVVYWAQGAMSRWTIANMRWGFAFYLDILVLMAVGVLSPLMVLPAWLAAWRSPPAVPAAQAAALARGVL